MDELLQRNLEFVLEIMLGSPYAKKQRENKGNKLNARI